MKKTLESLTEALNNLHSITMEGCIAWARLTFEKLFHEQIAQLIYNFPEDHITSAGAKFWSGPKRFPHAVTFNPDDPLHMDFIIAAAKLLAFTYNLDTHCTAEQVREVIKTVYVPEFVPKKSTSPPPLGFPKA